MNVALLMVVVLLCGTPILTLAILDRRGVFAILVAVVMFWAGFVLVVDMIGGCYPWSVCATHAKHKAGPE